MEFKLNFVVVGKWKILQYLEIRRKKSNRLIRCEWAFEIQKLIALSKFNLQICLTKQFQSARRTSSLMNDHLSHDLNAGFFQK